MCTWIDLYREASYRRQQLSEALPCSPIIHLQTNQIQPNVKGLLQRLASQCDKERQSAIEFFEKMIDPKLSSNKKDFVKLMWNESQQMEK